MHLHIKPLKFQSTDFSLCFQQREKKVKKEFQLCNAALLFNSENRTFLASRVVRGSNERWNSMKGKSLDKIKVEKKSSGILESQCGICAKVTFIAHSRSSVWLNRSDWNGKKKTQMERKAYVYDHETFTNPEPQKSASRLFGCERMRVFKCVLCASEAKTN